LFGICLLVSLLYYRRTRGTWYSILLPRSLQFKLFAVIGLPNALNGELTLASSPNTRTPPFVQQALFTMGPLFTALMHVFWLKESLNHYKTRLGLVFCVCLVGGVAIALAPLVQDALDGADSGTSNPVFWSSIFALGSLASCVSNVGQKWWLTHAASAVKSKLMARTPSYFTYFRMSFWQAIYNMVWILVLMPVDIIPGFGDSDSYEEFVGHASNVTASTLLPWEWTDYSYAGLLGLTFNLGYLMSFLGSLRLNHESVVFSSLVNVGVTWAAQVFFFLIPALEGPVDLPWWSIWIPMVLGSVGVLGFGYLEDYYAEHHKPEEASLLPINVDDDSSDEEEPEKKKLLP
jgi:hypothetical protein